MFAAIHQCFVIKIKSCFFDALGVTLPIKFRNLSQGGEKTQSSDKILNLCSHLCSALSVSMLQILGTSDK